MNTIAHKLAIAVALTLFLALPASEVNARQVDFQADPASPERDKGWATYGFGLDAPLDLGAGLTANFGRTHIWQVSLQTSQEFMLSGTGTNVTWLGVGRGYSAVGRWGRLAIAGGPAVVWGKDWYRRERPEGQEREHYVTGGLTLSGQAIFTPVREVGVGLELFGNVNPVISAVGVRAMFVFEGNK